MQRVPLLLVLLIGSAVCEATDIWVAPNGSDNAAGDQQHPLKSLHEAQRRVRKLPQRGKETVRVRIMPGTHYLHATLELTAADSGEPRAPVIFEGVEQNGQRPTISGGKQLNVTWETHNGVFTAGVPAELSTDQLFVNGIRQSMARYPNFDPDAQYFQGSAEDCISPERVARWQNPAGGFFHAMHPALWGDMHWRITGKDDSGRLQMEGGWQNNRPQAPHRKYRFVENIREELDAPGEWFLDRSAHQLLLIPPPGVDPDSAVIETVSLKKLIVLRGSSETPVHDIQLSGLHMTQAARSFMENREPLTRSDWTTYRGGALVLEGTEDCRISDCLIEQVGGNAIFVNHYNRRVTVEHCHISGAGASAVSLVGDTESLRSPLFQYSQTQSLEQMDQTPGPLTDNYPADCLIEDCLITGNGRVEKQTAGVNIAYAESVTIRNCSIYDCPRAGINICDGRFGGHLIEHNDVFDTVLETGDHGSFNSWGRDRFWHPDRKVTAEWVQLHPEMPVWDAGKTTIIRNNRWRCDHGWDIDLDDGSSNYKIYNNLCLAGGIKLREGYRRKVYNNILVDFTFCPHVWYPNSQSTFERNIIGIDQYQIAGMQRTDMPQLIDRNLVHDPAAAKPHRVTTIQKFGGDQKSLIGNADFVDPLSGDYRVQRDSPAVQLGFRNFPMTNFGVRNPTLRKIARTPALPGTLEAAGIRSGGWGRTYRTPTSAKWLGADIRNIAGDGEKSAVGLGDTEGVFVVTAPAGSTAATLGLQANDVIRRVNETPVKNLAGFSAVMKTGQRHVFSVWRNQGTVEISLKR